MRTAKAATVTVIPPTIDRRTQSVINRTTRRRVAGYARVSTDLEEQQTSYEAQVDYYTRHIQSNSDWEFVEVYTDEGISATTTKKRDGFNRMIQDALDGKVDLILTKSVSRFARNTVDTLTTVRKLKEKGVEVYFEKENIYTLDSKGELLITIMSSLAQEESRSISDNVSWGIRKRFADGKVILPYGQFLGYEKGEDGLPKIVEAEAEVVRLIYRMFLEGKTYSLIADILTEHGVPTPSGKRKQWCTSTIMSILSNEKYKGDALLQKQFTVDFLTKKKKVNEGEIPQYYVERSHEAVVSPETFDLVQSEIARRKVHGRRMRGASPFSSRIVCRTCGSFYGSKVWHSTDKYRRVVWQCNGKYKDGTKCPTPHLYETTLQQAFVGAFNSKLGDRDTILRGYEEALGRLSDTTVLEEERGQVEYEKVAAATWFEDSAHGKGAALLGHTEYENQYYQHVAKYEEAGKRLAELNKKIGERKAHRNRIEAYLKVLSQREQLLEAFDESLFLSTVEIILVQSQNNIIFQWKDGSQTPWKII